MLDLGEGRDRNAAAVAHLLQRPAIVRPQGPHDSAERRLPRLIVRSCHRSPRLTFFQLGHYVLIRPSPIGPNIAGETVRRKRPPPPIGRGGMRRMKFLFAGILALCGIATVAQTTPLRSVRRSPGRRPNRPPRPAPTRPAHAQITAQDVNAWLDGYMPNALRIGDIAGRRRRRRQGRPGPHRARLRLRRRRPPHARRSGPDPVPAGLDLQALHLDRGDAAGRAGTSSTSTPTSTPISTSRFRRATASRSRCARS